MLQPAFAQYVFQVISDIRSIDPEITNQEIVQLFEARGRLQAFLERYNSHIFSELNHIVEFQKFFFKPLCAGVYSYFQSESLEIRPSIENACSLNYLMIKATGMRQTSKESMINLLNAVIESLELGRTEGMLHDGDFGYEFIFDASGQP